MKKLFVLCVLLGVASVYGDLYMHNPRGSNNRLNGGGANRDNNNRLFDSQNNAKGGYCWGPSMSYYEGSLLSIEWTNQHGCALGKLECNLVIQYMCGTKDGTEDVRIRDGTTTDRIPDNEDTYNDKDESGNFLYGMHEPYSYYQQCKRRYRNKGLFVADRETRNDLNGQDARFTRQNNNAQRFAFECAEERDYYPYWHPSPWKDIAIITDKPDERCEFFQAESQNVKEKGICVTEEGEPARPNNERACTEENHVWKTEPSWGLPAPACVPTPVNRDNHLGNGPEWGMTNMFNWTLPTSKEESCIADDNCVCVLRMRYNISSTDIDGWGATDSTMNGGNSPITQDPYLPVEGRNLSMAIDTTQFGRTFQDRSHVFHIRPRPEGVPAAARIYNLNVRGKRGNIVQAYPAVEYDFTPNDLFIRVGDYVHFQWTGCDTNPAGNAGEGTDRTDRSNIVQIESLGLNVPATDAWLQENTALFEDASLRYYMAHIGQDESKCLTVEQLEAAGDDEDDNEGNCFKLNAAATPYFDGGLVKMNSTGDFYYMSSRNNNFTNRGQKGTIAVQSLLPTWAITVVVMGAVLFAGAGAAGAAMFYAKGHPESKINTLFTRL